MAIHTVVDSGTADLIDTAWLVDVGPFFDRFGTSKMAVLTSTNAIVQAIVKDCQVRKWIDLRSQATIDGVNAIAAVVAAVDATIKSNVLDNPAKPIENLALRKLYC